MKWEYKIEISRTSKRLVDVGAENESNAIVIAKSRFYSAISGSEGTHDFYADLFDDETTFKIV